MRLFIYGDKCTGCRICELVCSLKHDGVCNPTKSRIKVERRSVALDIPTVCIQCDERYCIASCPQGALSQAADGSIRVDEDLCTACGLCMNACPFDAIRTHPSKHVAMICDLCGGDPLCVKYCTTRALEVG